MKTIVLQVGNQSVTASEIIPRIVQYQMLPQLLREIIIDQAIASIHCTPEEIVSACDRFCAQHQLTNESSRQAWSQRYGITSEQVETLAVRQFKIAKFQQVTWGHTVESYFFKRKNQLDRVIYSLIRVKNAGVAQELYFRLAEGEQAWAELAQKYSQGPEAKTGGLVGPVPLGSSHPLISRLLFAGQPGQLWSPRWIEPWFVIVRLEKLIPAQLDASLRQRLLKELFENWLSEQVRAQLTAFLPQFSSATSELSFLI